jgi:hypothetical protein
MRAELDAMASRIAHPVNKRKKQYIPTKLEIMSAMPSSLASLSWVLSCRLQTTTSMNVLAKRNEAGYGGGE